MTTLNLVMQGPMVEELRRLGWRALDDSRIEAGHGLLRAVEAREFAREEGGSAPFRLRLGEPERALILEEAPWIAARFPEAFKGLPGLTCQCGCAMVARHDGAVWECPVRPNHAGHDAWEPKRWPTDHGLAERLRGRAVEDVIVSRSSGQERASNIAIRLDNDVKLVFTLPYGWHLDYPPERPSAKAVRLAEEARARG